MAYAETEGSFLSALSKAYLQNSELKPVTK